MPKRNRQQHPGGGRGGKGGASGKNKKQKNWHSNNAQKDLMGLGVRKAVLVTCDVFKEAQCVRETTNLLNEYADTLYPAEGGASDVGAGAGGDVESELERELAALRKKGSSGVERFKQYNSGVKGQVLIRVIDEKVDARELVEAVFKDIVESKVAKTRGRPLTTGDRYAVRFIPLQKMCQANMEAMVNLAKPMVTEFMEALGRKGVRFAVDYKASHNDGLDRNDVLRRLATVFGKDHKVDLKKPEVVLVVRVLQITCGMTITSNFKEYLDYNIRTVSDKHAVSTLTGGDGDDKSGDDGSDDDSAAS